MSAEEGGVRQSSPGTHRGISPVASSCNNHADQVGTGAFLEVQIHGSANGCSVKEVPRGLTEAYNFHGSATNLSGRTLPLFTLLLSWRVRIPNIVILGNDTTSGPGVSYQKEAP